MSKSERKRKELLDQAVRSSAASDGVTPNSELMISSEGSNLLIDICHDYSTHVTPSLSSAVEDFPSFPVTPSKPSFSKRGKTDKSGDDIISTLSDLINNRADGMEKLINNNAMRIEGLKKTVDFICAEVKDLKIKMTNTEKCIDEEKHNRNMLENHIRELEGYHRSWNLKLYGVPEKADQNVRAEVIHICQEVLPEGKIKLPDVIDTVHRLGSRMHTDKTRPVILQFTSRVHRDAVWKAARNNSYLCDNKLRFAEDFCEEDRERREKLWPAVKSARDAGKKAYYV
ncbi:hypothetical protein DPX16_11615 [Anabarilius grahami]|uniref:Uncharacterized protein n=1 Tax=Anabarilius grahami TaxID=495550 RepID=A0A3N0YJ42_ANAGA|nr:hypothetical protein DPX16_11615 [Anabarilius grahami]